MVADYSITVPFKGGSYNTALGTQLSWNGPDVTTCTVTFRLLTDASELADARIDP